MRMMRSKRLDSWSSDREIHNCLFNNQIGRTFNPKWCLLNWEGRKTGDDGASKPAQKVMERLTPWHYQNNTTRGLTPGLIDPTRPNTTDNFVPFPDRMPNEGVTRGQNKAGRKSYEKKLAAGHGIKKSRAMGAKKAAHVSMQTAEPMGHAVALQKGPMASNLGSPVQLSQHNPTLPGPQGEAQQANSSTRRERYQTPFQHPLGSVAGQQSNSNILTGTVCRIQMQSRPLDIPITAPQGNNAYPNVQNTFGAAHASPLSSRPQEMQRHPDMAPSRRVTRPRTYPRPILPAGTHPISPPQHRQPLLADPYINTESQPGDIIEVHGLQGTLGNPYGRFTLDVPGARIPIQRDYARSGWMAADFSASDTIRALLVRAINQSAGTNVAPVAPMVQIPVNNQLAYGYGQSLNHPAVQSHQPPTQRLNNGRNLPAPPVIHRMSVASKAQIIPRRPQNTPHVDLAQTQRGNTQIEAPYTEVSWLDAFDTVDYAALGAGYWDPQDKEAARQPELQNVDDTNQPSADEGTLGASKPSNEDGPEEVNTWPETFGMSEQEWEELLGQG